MLPCAAEGPMSRAWPGCCARGLRNPVPAGLRLPRNAAAHGIGIRVGQGWAGGAPQRAGAGRASAALPSPQRLLGERVGGRGARPSTPTWQNQGKGGTARLGVVCAAEGGQGGGPAPGPKGRNDEEREEGQGGQAKETEARAEDGVLSPEEAEKMMTRIEEELEKQLDEFADMLSNPDGAGDVPAVLSLDDRIRGTFYSFMALFVGSEDGVGTLVRDEEGVPLGEGGDRAAVVRQLKKLVTERGVDAATVDDVRARILGPANRESPFVAKASGQLWEFANLEVPEAYLFFGELKEGISPAVAAASLDAAVKRDFPDLRIALLPFPEDAEDIAAQFSIHAERKCALAVYQRFSMLHFTLLRFLTAPALLLTWFELKGIQVADPALVAGPDALQTMAEFLLAALQPVSAALGGQLLWAILYRAPLPFDFVPVPCPGAGVVALPSSPCNNLTSRRSSFDYALASTLGSLGASVAMLKSASCDVAPTASLLPLPDLETLGLDSIAPAASSTLPGTVLVPQNFLQHSGFLNGLADRLACAAFPDPRSDVDVLLALPPLAAAGLLGLHLTALGLIPFAFNGARMVEALVEDEIPVAIWSAVSLLFIVVCIFLTGAPTWFVYLISWTLTLVTINNPSLKKIYVDGVTAPGPLRAALSVSLIAGSFLILMPPPLFQWLQNAGFGPSIEALTKGLLPGT